MIQLVYPWDARRIAAIDLIVRRSEREHFDYGGRCRRAHDLEGQGE
jgi:hypothetical protein